jgi:hypothetical protein
MKKVKLYPAREGLIIRDPRTMKPLAETGEEKPKSGYWLRRIREGDVTLTPLVIKKKKPVTVEDNSK